VLEKKFKPEKDVLDFMKNALGAIEAFYGLYNKYKDEAMMDFRVSEVKLSKKSIDILDDKKGENAVLMHYLSSIVEKLHHASEELG
jgi:hypothetical protein